MTTGPVTGGPALPGAVPMTTLGPGGPAVSFLTLGQSIAAWVPPRPCGMSSAASAISTTLSVPRIIGALTWPMCAMRNALPDNSPMPWPSTTPHFSSQ